MPNRTGVSGISKFPENWRDNLERWTEIFETKLRKISVPFDFEPEFPEILVEGTRPMLLRLMVARNRITTYKPVAHEYKELEFCHFDFFKL